MHFRCLPRKASSPTVIGPEDSSDWGGSYDSYDHYRIRSDNFRLGMQGLQGQGEILELVALWPGRLFMCLAGARWHGDVFCDVLSLQHLNQTQNHVRSLNLILDLLLLLLLLLFLLFLLPPPPPLLNIMRQPIFRYHLHSFTICLNTITLQGMRPEGGR